MESGESNVDNSHNDETPPNLLSEYGKTHSSIPSKRNRAYVVIFGTLAIIGIVIATMFLSARHNTPAIQVPIPSGYTEVNEEQYQSMASSSSLALDAYYRNESTSSNVIVGHSRSNEGWPQSDNPDEFKKWCEENKQQTLAEFSEGFLKEYEGDNELEILSYGTEELSSGDISLHIAAIFTIDQESWAADEFYIVKGNAIFLIIIQSKGETNSLETIDFLKENVSFTYP